MEPYKQTPLDFIDDLLPSWSLNVQPFMKMPVAPFERPLPRLGNDRLPDLEGYQRVILCVATLLYASMYLIGWNFGFPTRAELTLWRVCSMFLFGNTVAFWVFETSAAWYRIGRWQRFFCRIFWKSKLADVEQARLTRESAKAPKELPLKAEFWSIFIPPCLHVCCCKVILDRRGFRWAKSFGSQHLSHRKLGDISASPLKTWNML
ncbi:hypothetical protein ACMYSQ_003000 [Aspergillus niger]